MGADGRGALKSSITCCGHDSPACYRLSLGLGHRARAQILEGDVWGALKIEHAFSSSFSSLARVPLDSRKHCSKEQPGRLRITKGVPHHEELAVPRRSWHTTRGSSYHDGSAVQRGPCWTTRDLSHHKGDVVPRKTDSRMDPRSASGGSGSAP